MIIAPIIPTTISSTRIALRHALFALSATAIDLSRGSCFFRPQMRLDSYIGVVLFKYHQERDTDNGEFLGRPSSSDPKHRKSLGDLVALGFTATSRHRVWTTSPTISSKMFQVMTLTCML